MRNRHGVVGKDKAKFVAKVFKQTKVVDFGETFAPTSWPEMSRLVLVLAAEHNLHLEELDVNSAFLYAEMKEEVFIKQPEGFTNNAGDGSKIVCKLNESINGRKQTSKNWYYRLEASFLDETFQQSKSDYCLHLKSEDSVLTYIPVWVDNVIVAKFDLEPMKSLKEK